MLAKRMERTLLEPSATTPPPPPPSFMAAARAPTSMGSPSGVPVPCSDTALTAAAATPAAASAVPTSAVWAGPLGAVSPLLRPHWLTAEPSSRACGPPAQRSGAASSARLTASPRPYPSAEASNVWHRPTGESACRRQMRAVVCGMSITLTPPTRAPALSPRQMPCAHESAQRPRVSEQRSSRVLKHACMQASRQTTASCAL
jgi:hypothetical protein